jgi:hypothetical protein
VGTPDRGGTAVKVTKPLLTFEPKHYFALVGLSEPKVYDDVVGAHVPFKLSEAERKYFMEESITDEQMNYAMNEAQHFFKSNYPNGHIYYKKSRWSISSPLHVLSINKQLNGVSW